MTSSTPVRGNGTYLSAQSPRPRSNTIESGHGIHGNHGNKRQKFSVPSVFSVAIHLTLAKVSAIAVRGWQSAGDSGGHDVGVHTVAAQLPEYRHR